MPARQGGQDGRGESEYRSEGGCVLSEIGPGWYKDPAEPTTQRYWDGEGWIGDPLPLSATPPEGPPRDAGQIPGVTAVGQRAGGQQPAPGPATPGLATPTSGPPATGSGATAEPTVGAPPVAPGSWPAQPPWSSGWPPGWPAQPPVPPDVQPGPPLQPGPPVPP
ncbi:MAG: DUF2510 domain-containing protein, partial [Micromonosporaceae bacterium]|nr:DUF2510 domain-containing protein [Micromonosporaceae bacterium]